MQRQFPFLTIGFMVFTVLVMIVSFTSFDGSKSANDWFQITRQMEKIRAETYIKESSESLEDVQNYLSALDVEFPDTQTRFTKIFPLRLKTQSILDPFWARFYAETLSVYGQGGPTYLHWKAFEENLAKIKNDTPAYDFALTPAEPFSFLSFLISPFLHHGYLHLLLDLFFFYILAGSLEDQIGRMRLAITIFISAYFSASISALALQGENVFIVGLSGVIYGLCGIFVAYFGSTEMKMNLGFDVLETPAYGVIPGYLVLDHLFRIYLLPHATYTIAWGPLASFALGLISLLLFGQTQGLIYRRLASEAMEPLSRKERKKFAELNADIDQARTLIAQGDVQKGIIKLKTILGSDSQNLPAHQVLFEALLNHGTESQARLEASKIINKYLILDHRLDALEIYRAFNLHYPDRPLDIPREVLMEPEESNRA